MAVEEPAAVPAHPIEERLEHLAALREEALHAGSEAAVARQHDRGKLTARERIDLLLDPGSFVELDMLARHRAHGFGIEDTRPLTDGVVTGWGTVDGRKVFLFSQDFTVFGGALGEVFAQKIHKVMDLAESVGAPLIGLNDGAGARIQEGVTALAGYGGIFRRNVRAAGVIPPISLMLGPGAGGPSYSPGLTDFVFMVRGISYMFLTGPDVIQEVTGEQITQEGLGGADVHSSTSGLATFVYDDEESCFEGICALLSLLPPNNREEPQSHPSADPRDRRCEALTGIVPAEPNKPYDMHAVITEIVDDGEFLELHADWARNVVCVLARMDGRTVGIVANQ